MLCLLTIAAQVPIKEKSAYREYQCLVDISCRVLVGSFQFNRSFPYVFLKITETNRIISEFLGKLYI